MRISIFNSTLSYILRDSPDDGVFYRTHGIPIAWYRTSICIKITISSLDFEFLVSIARRISYSSLDFEFGFRISSFDFEFRLSSFDCEFLFRVSISRFDFDFEFRFRISSFDFEFSFSWPVWL